MHVYEPKQDFQHKLPLCDRAQMAHGDWQPRRYDRLPYLPQQLAKKTCYTPEDLTRPWDTYEWQPFAAPSPRWQPPACRFEAWKTDDFCELARNQTIALAGDSAIIPVDEVIDAMGEVGASMEDKYKETALGGIANTPTARAIENRVLIQKVEEVEE